MRDDRVRQRPTSAANDELPLRAAVGGHAISPVVRGAVLQRCAPENPGCDCGKEAEEYEPHAVQRAALSGTTLLSLQRLAGNHAASALATPATGHRTIRKNPPPRPELKSGEARVQRYYIEDCDPALAGKRLAGVRIAVGLARKAARALTSYSLAANQNPRVCTGGTPDPHTRDLLQRCFGDAGASTVLRARDGFQEIAAYLAADDFTIECESDCDAGTNAYVYAFLTDIHLCSRNLRGASDDRIGEILVHEVSHVVVGTDDNEYFYPPAGGRTSLDPADAIENADSFEAFAAQI